VEKKKVKKDKDLFGDKGNPRVKIIRIVRCAGVWAFQMSVFAINGFWYFFLYVVKSFIINEGITWLLEGRTKV